MEKLHNFVYKLTLKSDPRYYYYGKHSTNLDPEKDPYLGSGLGLLEYKQAYGPKCFDRIVLADYPTKKEALKEEAKVIGSLWKTDPFCLNRIPGGAFQGKFDCTGLIHIVKDGIFRNIDPSQLEAFEKDGWIKGQPKSEKAKKSIRRAVTKLWKDPDYREHQRLSHLGNTSHLGHKVSEEGRKRMSEAGKHPKPWLKGRIVSEEQRKKSSECNKNFRWVNKESKAKKSTH